VQLGFNTASVLISVLAESLALALIGGLLGGLAAYLAFQRLPDVHDEFQTFSQVAFAFAGHAFAADSGPELRAGDGLVAGCCRRSRRHACDCDRAAGAIGFVGSRALVRGSSRRTRESGNPLTVPQLAAMPSR